MSGDFQPIIDAARASTTPTKLTEVDGIQWWLVPGAPHQNSEVVKVETWKEGATPRRKQGRVVVFDAASFNQVLKDNADAGNITIYFDRNPNKPLVCAVLNGNGPNGPGWGDFRVTLEFRPTPQWVKWREQDGKLLQQIAFAELIEDNLDDIAEPTGATMLEIATYLETTRTLNYKSGVRLQSGLIQFRHEQSEEAKVGNGTLDVPEEFTLGVAPIFGLPSYRVPARFRYRVKDGTLYLGYKLQRVETMMAKIVEDVISNIERGANISVLDGLPPPCPT